MDPQITLAIPFHSGRHYLTRAMESVLKQTVDCWELIVCDDASSEPGIGALVRSYGDPRLRYDRNPVNLGMVGNWNRCHELARTDLVTLLHADDELQENYCELMLRAGEQHPRAAAIFCQTRIINESNQKRLSFPDLVKRFLLPGADGPIILHGEEGLRHLLRGNFIMCPTLCYRRTILDQRRFAPEWKFVQDLEFISRLLLEGETVVGLREVGYDYRRHANSATVKYTQNLQRFHEEVSLYDLLEKQALQRKWTRAARVAQEKWIIKSNLFYCACADLSRLRIRQALAKLALLGRLLPLGSPVEPQGPTTSLQVKEENVPVSTNGANGQK